MNVSKAKLESILEEYSENVDIEDLMYCLSLLEKIETGEKDIKNCKTLSNTKAIERLPRKWQN